jgi:hypothetical protein
MAIDADFGGIGRLHGLEVADETRLGAALTQVFARGAMAFLARLVAMDGGAVGLVISLMTGGAQRIVLDELGARYRWYRSANWWILLLLPRRGS